MEVNWGWGCSAWRVMEAGESDSGYSTQEQTECALAAGRGKDLLQEVTRVRTKGEQGRGVHGALGIVSHLVWLDLWGIERQGSLGLARLTEEFGFLPKDPWKRWRTPTAETDGAVQAQVFEQRRELPAGICLSSPSYTGPPCWLKW